MEECLTTPEFLLDHPDFEARYGLAVYELYCQSFYEQHDRKQKHAAADAFVAQILPETDLDQDTVQLGLKQLWNRIKQMGGPKAYREYLEAHYPAN